MHNRYLNLKIGKNYNVEHTGTVFNFENKTIDIEFLDLTIEITFFKDDSGKTSSDISFINDHLLRIDLFNFSEQFSFSEKPEEILIIGNKKYFLDMVISNLEDQRMLIHFMILSKEII